MHRYLSGAAPIPKLVELACLRVVAERKPS
jgi:hypothetical protein